MLIASGRPDSPFVPRESSSETGRGVAFEKPPQKLVWGYGAVIRDGYLVYLWDEKSMREEGSG